MNVPEYSLLRRFSTDHMKPDLRCVVEQYKSLAEDICENIEASPERTLALRSLIESKDNAVRAVVLQLEKAEKQ